VITRRIRIGVGAAFAMLAFAAPVGATISFSNSPGGSRSRLIAGDQFLYKTDYSGTYTHKSSFVVSSGGSLYRTVTYRWQSVVSDTYTSLGGRKFRRKTVRELHGYVSDLSVLPPANGSVLIERPACHFNETKTTTTEYEGTAQQGSSRTRLLEVDWGIPDSIDWRGHSETCFDAYNSIYDQPFDLPYTAATARAAQTHTCLLFIGGGAFPVCPSPTNAFFDAWGNGAVSANGQGAPTTGHGSVLIPFDQVPYERTFHVGLGPTSVSQYLGPNLGTQTAMAGLTIDSKLTFTEESLGNLLKPETLGPGKGKRSGTEFTTPKESPTTFNNKIGNALVGDGVDILAGDAIQTGQNSAVGLPPPPPSLYPGMPETGVMTEAVGQVLPPTKTVDQSAGKQSRTASSKLLFTSSARVRQGVNFKLALTPTTLGRALLHSNHAAISVRVVLTFRPASRRYKTLSGSQTVTIPGS
jgi:hypothetical protein